MRQALTEIPNKGASGGLLMVWHGMCNERVPGTEWNDGNRSVGLKRKGFRE